MVKLTDSQDIIHFILTQLDVCLSINETLISMIESLQKRVDTLEHIAKNPNKDI